ncbi:MAG: DNA-binding NtrC family response regulator [Kiritimatiellia bacterium]|jgi:DNA-binding NtrC family response regulator
MQEEAEVVPTSSLAEARAAFADTDFDFALLDINLPDGSSLDLLAEDLIPASTAVVVMTADGGVESAVQAMKRGAADYLTKPFDPFELPLVFERCQHEREEVRRREHEHARIAHTSGGLFWSPGLEPVKQQIDRMIETDFRMDGRLPPILVQGETGTGKSTFARLLHHSGPRAARPFIELNCATLPENLVESELFGHERGAFTDAREARIGLFEAASQGTLFLDEISSLPPTVQAKLLTAIEDGVIRRVGSNTTIQVDVRLIAASLEDLETLVKAQTFRSDLYHRLNVLRLDIPPLRNRPDDILLLARHLLGHLKRRYRLPDAAISAEGAERLKAYAWPGNVRELSHELERQLVLCGNQPLAFDQLSTRAANEATDWLATGWQFPEQGFSIEDANLRLIQQALAQAGNNVTAAARLLGVNRDYIRYRLDKSESGE